MAQSYQPYRALSQKLWRAGADFRSKLDIPCMQKNIELTVDDHVNFLTCHCLHFGRPFVSCSLAGYNTISDSGLWGLLYYTSYLTGRPLQRNPWYVTE